MVGVVVAAVEAAEAAEAAAAAEAVVARQPRRKVAGKSRMMTQKAVIGVKSKLNRAQMARYHPKAAVDQLVMAPL